jgi:SWIM zinc finger
MCLNVSKQLIDRQEHGRIISQMKGTINRIDDTCYTVNSQSGNGSYNVNANELGWNCSCPGHIYGGVKCKHIYAVELSFAIRKQVEVTRMSLLLINVVYSANHLTSSGMVLDTINVVIFKNTIAEIAIAILQLI